MKVSIIKNKNVDYQIFVGSGAIKLLKTKIKFYCPNANKIALIFDKKVPSKYKVVLKKQLKNYKVYLHEYFVNENLKSFTKVNSLSEKLIKNNFNRNDVIISVGGGIIGDFAGFTASIVKRGINFINIPTTLLSQVDASVGGKTGINTIKGKNLIGSFYQPKMIITDLDFLRSLTKRDLICGFAEILKHSLIHDKNFFRWLKKNTKKIIEDLDFATLKYAIIKSCKIKLYFVSKDEREKSIRMKLNFGHTFAHGIEAACNFSRKINHGEAVLVGMNLATKLSFKKKSCSFETLSEIDKFYSDNNLPSNLGKYFSKKNFPKIIQYMIGDKKNVDEKINFILIKRIGKTSKPGNYKIKVRDMNNIINRLVNFNF